MRISAITRTPPSDDEPFCCLTHVLDDPNSPSTTAAFISRALASATAIVSTVPPEKASADKIDSVLHYLAPHLKSLSSGEARKLKRIVSGFLLIIIFRLNYLGFQLSIAGQRFQGVVLQQGIPNFELN